MSVCVKCNREFRNSKVKLFIGDSQTPTPFCDICWDKVYFSLFHPDDCADGDEDEGDEDDDW